ncbi:MAG: type III secretion system inner membrane ring subunit SctD [Puniceicoccales bacterium]|jgi:type III secretion system YscD/HrpQ family protein|nr:type III secretion system inner membrane ring subunit SctD [Puniceicoccales bacterium]
MGLVLKVLSGPHQGAEFDVPDEEIIIGAADECDVIISDVLVANKHVNLKVVDGRVFITPLEGNVFVSGKLLREPSAIDNFQFVTIGATHMMVGEGDGEQWQTVSLGDFPELEKVEEAVSVFTESTEEGGQEPTKNTGEAWVVEWNEKGTTTKKEFVADSAAELIETTELADRESAKAKFLRKIFGERQLTWKQIIIRYTLGFVVCFLIAAGASIAVVVFSQKGPVPAAPQPMEVRVQKAIDDLKLKNKIKVSKVGDGPVSVVGYVDKMEDSVAVKSALKPISEDISIKLLVMEKVLSSAMEMVKESKQNIVLKQAEEFGELIATGYVKKEEVWTNLKSEVSSIKGITNIRDEVLTKTSIVELAKTVLERHKFSDKLEIAANDEGVEISGTITDADKDKWGVTREDFEKTFKKKAQVSFKIAVSTDRNLTIEKFFGGKIDSVNFNSQGLDWVNIKGGTKYFQGSVLPSGYVIDRVEQDSVTIRNADEVVTLDLKWI